MTLNAAQTIPYGTQATLTPVPTAADARALAAHLRDHLDQRAAAVVPGAQSVVVTAAPGTPLGDLLATVTALATTCPAASPVAPTTHVLPVTYDGEDLAAVASLLGCSPEAVVARHAAATYTVDFLGFAPGFPYLSGLDPFLTVPRLDSPRTRVPVGSVGLAAGATCVYPVASPGGWRLIGRTSRVLFDPTRDRPALLAAGDRVRFEAVR